MRVRFPLWAVGLSLLAPGCGFFEGSAHVLADPSGPHLSDGPGPLGWAAGLPSPRPTGEPQPPAPTHLGQPVAAEPAVTSNWQGQALPEAKDPGQPTAVPAQAAAARLALPLAAPATTAAIAALPPLSPPPAPDGPADRAGQPPCESPGP
jgi:hypothetical protein